RRDTNRQPQALERTHEFLVLVGHTRVADFYVGQASFHNALGQGEHLIHRQLRTGNLLTFAQGGVEDRYPLGERLLRGDSSETVHTADPPASLVVPDDLLALCRSVDGPHQAHASTS